jgi:hypothetical protein
MVRERNEKRRVRLAADTRRNANVTLAAFLYGNCHIALTEGRR